MSMSRVFFYVPNVIGYVRAVLLLVAFFFALDAPVVFIVLYSLSYGILDILDGLAARMLDQRSRFGAALDMVIDRSSTSCLLAILAICYPQVAPLFFLLIALDVSSHYVHMLASEGRSHKVTSRAEHGTLLHLYYSSPPFLFVLVTAHELTALALYAYSFIPGPLLEAVHAGLQTTSVWWQSILTLILLIGLPLAALKTVISVIQFVMATRTLAARAT